jgi:glycosyltransferase involved in cell wall biosynthesis
MKQKPSGVIVFASSYPSQSQPWIETHLGQLEAEGLDFIVVSSSDASLVPAASMDVRYRERISFLDSSISRVIRSALEGLARNFIRELSAAISAWKFLSGCGLRARTKLRFTIYTLYLRRVLKPKPPAEVIHIHFDQTAPPILAWAALAGIPVVCTFHGLDPYGVPQMHMNLRRLVYAKVSLLLVNTPFAKRVVEALGCDKDKTRILPQSIRLQDFPFTPPSPPLQGERLRLLTVGRLQREKGQAYAVLAAARLKALGVSFHWRIIGKGEDRNRLARLIQRLELENCVELINGLAPSELKKAYSDSHLTVVPSVSNAHGYAIETQGIVVQEAQAMGSVVIASRVGGLQDCISDGIDGVLVPERTSAAIADAIQVLLSDPSRWQRMATAARERVERQFNSDVNGKRLVSEYMRVAESCWHEGTIV